MMRWPRSLFARLLALASLTTLAALVFAAFSIGHVLERFATRGLDQILDAQVRTLARAVHGDGSVDRARAISLPPFEESGSGWSWRIEAPGRRPIASAPSPALPSLDPVGPPPPPPPRAPDPDRPRPGEAIAAGGRHLHYRQIVLTTAIGPVTITAAAPRRVAEAPLRDAMVPLLLSLGLLGAGLAIATLLQVRLGLRPLGTLRIQLAEVRGGRARAIPGDQPAEIAPLAAEVNALIEQNEAGLAHARRHVANLAHGLKTPLATLRLRLDESGEDAGLTAIVDRMDGQIRHHLRRAQAASPHGGSRARTAIDPAVRAVADALRRIHADRPILFDAAVPPDLATPVDPQDLDEMLGNLLDNGWRHARSRVSATVTARDDRVEIAIEDDGPGVPESRLADILLPGRRLDEREDGHGFGLAITEELATLNGGGLVLTQAHSGTGLRAILTLPARA